MRIAISLIAAAFALTSCSSAGNTAAAPPGATPTTTPAAASEPRTEAAVRPAATEEFDSYSSGDYGGAWDLYYAAAKRAISRADYLRAHKLCPDAGAGIRFEIEKVRMDSDHEAHVRVTRAIVVLTYRFVYEAGHWRYVPTDEAMHDFRTKTVEKMVSDLKQKGGCSG
ncbi:hypothetical protein [Actinomadura sp. DC4]|uniref:hypothetical protein n=1 Tax=Actinomadura sp. DC4 TaxID=3055069 RepID=UPI0025B0597D|nr:hypothetical protein [Actinomadura sp. DC4]MDN3359726.1 hypothetical protein [Actinomadura sp. DC4]